MYEVFLTWVEFKADIISKGFPLNYKTLGQGYEVFVIDRQIRWVCPIRESSDTNDFETNYKSKCNVCLYDASGKEYSRTESRPLDCTTYFSGAGDIVGNIGEGKEIEWDFSNDEDIISGGRTGYKKKRIEFKFIDVVYIKSGVLYYKDVPKDCHIDFYVVCPMGNYYYDNNNVPRLATVDTAIARYINKHHASGTCSGDKAIDPESCSSQIPSTYKFWLDIETELGDNVSSGSVTLMIYRKRTLIL